MKIIEINGKTREQNKQLIIVNSQDKYGVGTIAYFKNSLNGQNVQKLAVKNCDNVQLFHNRVKGEYTLQILKFNIDHQCILNNYSNFQKKYDTLIKDKIARL